MKKRSIFLCACMLGILSSVLSQNPLTEKEKNAIQAIRMLSEGFFNPSYDYLVPSSFVFDSPSKFKEQIFDLLPGYYDDQRPETGSTRRIGLRYKGDEITRGYFSTNCTYTDFLFVWSGDSVKEAMAYLWIEKWKLEYNRDGKISRIAHIDFGKLVPGSLVDGKPHVVEGKSYTKDSVTFEYTTRGELSAVNKFKNVGRAVNGKFHSEFVYQDLRKQIYFDPSTHRWTIELTKFKGKQSGQQKEEIESTNKIMIQRSADKISISQHDTEILINGEGLPYQATINEPGRKQIYRYEYNTLGQIVVCRVEIFKPDGSFLHGVETIYEYTLNPGKDPGHVCSYEPLASFSQYADEIGVYKQTKHGMIRLGDGKGNWGEWKGRPHSHVEQKH